VSGKSNCWFMVRGLSALSLALLKTLSSLSWTVEPRVSAFEPKFMEVTACITVISCKFSLWKFRGPGNSLDDLRRLILLIWSKVAAFSVDTLLFRLGSWL